MLIELEHIEFNRPRLDRTDDPRGWNRCLGVLAVGGALLASTLLAIIEAVNL